MRLTGRNPIGWRPPEPTDETGYDIRYWGRVLAEAERWLQTPGLTFVITFSPNELPCEGADVVVLEVGDDDPRIPPWSSRVLATFKTAGLHPELGRVPWRHPGAAAVAFGLHSRTWLRHLPGAWERALAGRAAHGVPPVHELPLGYHTQLELPLRPINERQFALSFAGSVRHWHGWYGTVTSRLAPPKAYSRRRMLEAVERLCRRRPDLPVNVRIESGFYDVSPDTGHYDPANARSYSEMIMDTKLLLAPRGTNAETARHFAGLRAGCVVLTDEGPNRWYLRGAPFVVLPSWNDLEDVAPSLLGSEEQLERLHRAGLRWWRENCSEARIGRWMATCVDAAAASHKGPIGLRPPHEHWARRR